jgi:CBS domain-containing protein
MTDFKQRAPVTVESNATIGQALATMMHSGVRLLFVLDAGSRLVGLVSSYDIQGEKPMRYLQSQGFTHRTSRHDDVRVGDIMEPTDAWHVLSFDQVCRATVADIVSTFKQTGRSHLVVIEPGDGPRRYVVRGLISATHVGKQLGMALEFHGATATFAELEEALNGGHVLK